MQKLCCVCGEPIPVNWRLCTECAEEYGTNPRKWPEWLRFAVSDTEREWDAARRSPEIDMADIEIIHHDPRVTLLERFDGNGFVILRGCEECE